ncbi:HAD family phosphatase [Halomonas sp. ISL-60]|uniref:HAD family hydrolase n=1 Tax=Halomonas sp. ISL-56 TaxID=2819149 RepID=UPI001BE74348|nr:HAD family phosphatase [Halomonas sp. ISL-56]MBT2773704.1 HAD family phosphatase [Halomonas sp. ISL-60]MBT2803203.1 HAD family phosphatase [Halomonas sp. ISL-56]
MKLRAILFDHDGTLVNSEPVHYRMWAHVLQRYGFTLSEQQYKTHYAGVPTPANAIDLVQRYGIDESPELLAEAKNAATREYLERQAFPLMPGVKEAISYFHSAGLKLAVVTGASANGVQTTLRVNELEHYFSAIVSGDDVRASKPAPDCYLLALQQLGVSAAECLAIEDTQHGLEAAYQAGINCVALPTEMSLHHDFRLAVATLGGMTEAVGYVREVLLGSEV